MRSWRARATLTIATATGIALMAGCSQVAGEAGVTGRPAPFTIVTSRPTTLEVVDTVTTPHTTTAVVTTTDLKTLNPEPTIPPDQVGGTPPADFNAYANAYFAARWVDPSDPAVQERPYCVKLRTETPGSTCWVVTVWSAVNCPNGFSMKIDFFDGPRAEGGKFLGREDHVYALPVTQGQQLDFTFVDTYIPATNTVSALIADMRCV